MSSALSGFFENFYREGYKIKGTDWIELDATCKICEFGQISAINR